MNDAESAGPGRPGRLLREPLVHFLAIGAAIFIADLLLAPEPDERPPERIVVSAGRIEELAERWRRTTQRPPTPQELDGLIENYVRDEVFAREAVALGLDRDDVIIRRRLRQKMEFVAEGFVGEIEPTTAELEAFFTQNAGQYVRLPLLSFSHVYLNPQTRGPAAREDAARLLDELTARRAATVDPTAEGDRFLLPHRYDRMPLDDVASRFGADFATRLDEVVPGRWAGPLDSGYGLHLVLVHERLPQRAPGLAEVRDTVRRDLDALRRQEASELLYRRLRERYEIVISEDP